MSRLNIKSPTTEGNQTKNTAISQPEWCMCLVGLDVESGLPKEYVTTGLLTLVFGSILLHAATSTFKSLVGNILNHLAKANTNLCKGTHLNPGPAGRLAQHKTWAFLQPAKAAKWMRIQTTKRVCRNNIQKNWTRCTPHLQSFKYGEKNPKLIEERSNKMQNYTIKRPQKII